MIKQIGGIELPPPELAADPFVDKGQVEAYRQSFSVERLGMAIRLTRKEDPKPASPLIGIPDDITRAMDIADQFPALRPVYGAAIEAGGVEALTLPTLEGLNNEDLFPTRGLDTADLEFVIVNSDSTPNGSTPIRPYITNGMQGFSSVSSVPELYAHDATAHFLRMRYLPRPSFVVYQLLGADAFALEQIDPDAANEYLCSLGEGLDSVTGKDFPVIYDGPNTGLISSFERSLQAAAKHDYPYMQLIHDRVKRVIDGYSIDGQSIIDWENQNWDRHYVAAAEQLRAA